MPKIVDYPRSSFNRALEVAKAVDSLGGKCSRETCANQMGLKMTGSYSALLGGALKFNLISASKGDLQVTDMYKSIKLAYSDEEKRIHEIRSFLTPTVFRTLYERFINNTIPEKILDKLLIKEFDVEEKMAPKVAGYFLKGLKELELLDESGILKKIDNSNTEDSENIIEETEEVEPTTTQLAKQEATHIIQESDEYSVHIKGPGMDSTIVIKEMDDLTIVSAMLNKVKNKLSQ